MINKLVLRVEVLENKINKKEEVVAEKENVQIELDDFEVTAKEINVETETLKCSKCSFETIHKNGLKIHMKRKHVKASKTCDLCNKQFDSVRDMKMHKNTHSFNGDFFGFEFKCEECDYISETIETMEVHIGKCCYDHFECGLCEAHFENFEMLELHLVTCEVYECGKCFIRVKNLSEMKKHIKEEHEDGKYLHHLKIDRNDDKIVSFKQVSIDNI